MHKKLACLVLILMISCTGMQLSSAKDSSDLVTFIQEKNNYILQQSNILLSQIESMTKSLQKIKSELSSLKIKLSEWKLELEKRQLKLNKLQAQLDELEKRPVVSDEELQSLQSDFDDYVKDVEGTIGALRFENTVLKITTGVAVAGFIASLVYLLFWGN